MLQPEHCEPYFFNAPSSGVVVQPAVYTFICRFFANHSAENVYGGLNQDVLKSFFAISGQFGNFNYTPRGERIAAIGTVAVSPTSTPSPISLPIVNSPRCSTLNFSISAAILAL